MLPRNDFLDAYEKGAESSTEKNSGSQEENEQKEPQSNPDGGNTFDLGALENILKKVTATPDEPVLPDFSLKAVAAYIKSGKVQNIVVMTGAGISTAAGVPDFRSPNSGVYETLDLEKYGLRDPQEIFTINHFMMNPAPFFLVSKEIMPNNLQPTTAHYFIKLIYDKGLLLRNYTQNIDALEHDTGIPADKIVEAHGSMNSGTCTMCKKKYAKRWILDMSHKAEDSVPRCERCEGVVKPDIVFFGEALPNRFFQCATKDLPQCDLLLIMGTSLVVHPFASLIDWIGGSVPRLLINRDAVGQRSVSSPWLSSFETGGLLFEEEDNKRDVFWQGNCDDGCKQLAELLGWQDDLEKLIGMGNATKKTNFTTSQIITMPTKVELTREEPFSHSHKYFGQKAKFFSLTNSKNNKVCVMNLGGCVTSWIVHDAHAKSIDVVCGFASLQGYEQDEFFMGQIVGRVANRIANGQFSVNGRDYQLTCNNGPNCNHSAQRNYGYRLWDASIIKDMDTSDEKLQLKLVDNPEDDLDFPGRCNVCATYSYMVNDELKIEIIAECDEISPVNMTSHIYFNLDGHGHGSISEQEIQINASHYLPTDESDLVTGEIVPVNMTNVIQNFACYH